VSVPLHLGFDADQPYHLKRSRLVTHGVVLGMTGSGKTGLCVDLLEEVASSGVPALVIDPKGDLAHLGQPWPDDESERWLEGLAASGVGEERIRHLRERVAVTVHTPGSTASHPIDVVGALAAPDGLDAESLAEAATSAATAVLALAGVHGDPVRDPRLVVAATLVRDAWSKGESLDAEQLVLRLVDPPVKKIGVFPVDNFLPRAERMELAMALNGVLASPSFAAWSTGEPLDLDAMLAPVKGRTPVHVMYLAHLDEAARSFFCTLLLSRLVAWMRRQEGSDDLRALLFFDEVFGFLPPHPRMPPTKRPLLTLLKQGRASGVGVVLCTQNPVDIDYKALGNTGWWAVGRLSTAQDRDRVLDGLLGTGDDRAAVEAQLSSLPPWSFVVRDVREPGVRTVRSRWAISYLGGPVTLQSLRDRAGGASSPAAEPAAPSAPPPPPTDDTLPAPPPLPDRYEQRVLGEGARFGPDLRSLLGDGRPPRADGLQVYAPALLATAHMLFDERGGFRHERTAQRLFFPLHGDPEPHEVELDEADLARLPDGPARFEPLPEGLDEGKELDAFARAVRDQLLRAETTELYKHAPTKLSSHGGESRQAFEARVAAAIDDRIDERVAKLRDKVAKQVDRLEAKRDKLERDLVKHRTDAQAKLATEVVNVGETLFGMFFGGRSRSLSSAVSKRGATARAQERATAAEEGLKELDRELYDAEVELQDEVRAIEVEERSTGDDIEVRAVSLERDDLRVEMCVVWVPQARPF
jgi:hypothetical protein